MKIIQLVTGYDQDDGNGDHTLYGLGDDGCLYQWQNARSPRLQYKSAGYVRWALPGQTLLADAIDFIYHDGCTQGWVLVGGSAERSVPIPHPQDPTRTQRS